MSSQSSLYAFWMTSFVIPFMLVCQAAYTIIDRNKLVMSILGAIVSFVTIYIAIDIKGVNGKRVCVMEMTQICAYLTWR